MRFDRNKLYRKLIKGQASLRVHTIHAVTYSVQTLTVRDKCCHYIEWTRTDWANFPLEYSLCATKLVYGQRSRRLRSFSRYFCELRVNV